MQIQIRCQCGGECKEWAIVELQGSLELQDPKQQIFTLPIGTLCRSTQEEYSFTVGYHQLEGRRVTLKKPLLVLKKQKQQQQQQQQPNAMQIDQQTTAPEKLEVAGIIKHKILFKTRPKALISKTEDKHKKPRL